ncbi:MAG: CRISPR-associated protein Cas5 [Candidatus Kapabacteria bacterium]|nr:CRISPR-associated protein Cas5 [Candidatus Kapabacteria bacterium]
MKAIQLIIQGDWGHFKRPETNNNPLTHDFITKTALIGLIGAVLGIEREDMKQLFPILSSNLLYGVQLLNPVKKFSWGFSSRTAFEPVKKGSPKYFEFLKDPKFKVTIALKEEESKDIFQKFSQAVINSESVYTAVLGWHNCPAAIYFNDKGYFSEILNGDFETFSFVEKPPIHKPILTKVGFRIGFDKIPTFQNDDFWNLPEYYKEVIYPASGYLLKVNGNYYQFSEDKSQWWLI